MKYRIIEEIDGLGNSVFYAQYEELSLFLKKPKWVYEMDGARFCIQRFDSPASALRELKRYRTPKKVNVVQEGDL